MIRFSLFCALVIIVTLAQAESFSDRLYNRQIIKQRERFKLSDLPSGKARFPVFFSINKDISLFENNISLGMGKTIQQDERAQEYNGSLFFTILGLELDHKDLTIFEATTAQANLRLLGSSQQNSRLNIFFGERKTKADEVDSDWEQMVSGYEAQIYLLNQLGVSWRQTYLTRVRNDDDESLTGNEDSLEGFLEYGAFRVLARYTWSRLKTSHATWEPRVESLVWGLGFFF